jgi:hypothetical protein
MEISICKQTGVTRPRSYSEHRRSECAACLDFLGNKSPRKISVQVFNQIDSLLKAYTQVVVQPGQRETVGRELPGEMR